MKNLNLFKSNVSGMDREWIENGSGLTRHHGKLWKHVAMIFAVLVMSVANIGTAWGAETSMPTSGSYSTNTKYAFSNSAVTGGYFYLAQRSSISKSSNYGWRPYNTGIALQVSSPVSLTFTIKSNTTSSRTITGQAYAVTDPFFNIYKNTTAGSQTLENYVIAVNAKSAGSRSSEEAAIAAVSAFAAITGSADANKKLLICETGAFSEAVAHGAAISHACPTTKGATNTFTVNLSAAGKYVIYLTSSNGDVGITKINIVPRKTIYMIPGDWNGDTPKFFVHSWGDFNDDVLMTLANCETNVFKADIPTNNTNLLFTRQNPSSTSIAYKDQSGNWNQSADITISTNNKFTFSAWDGGGGKSSFTGGTYSAPTFTVTYNANGSSSGSVPVDGSSPYACSSNATVLGNTGNLAKAGKAFGGWNTESGGGGTTYAPGATIINITDNIILYAKWETAYSVTYNANGGSGSVPSDGNSYANGATVTVLDKNTLTKSDYVFAGWNTKSDGTGTWYDPSETFSMGTKNVTLYAQWAACISTSDFSGRKDAGNNTLALTKTDLTSIFHIVHQLGGSTVYDNSSGYVGLKLRNSGDWIGFGVAAGNTVTITTQTVNTSPNVTIDFAAATTLSANTDNDYAADGSNARYFRIKAADGAAVVINKITIGAAACTAPTVLAAGSTTAKGTTFTVTDGENTNNYEIVCKTTSGTPAVDATPTYTSTSNTKAVTDLVAGTTYYAWVRSVCGVGNKSDWVALTGNTFTTSQVTVTHTLTNVTATSGATGANAAGGSDYTAVFTANTGYSMPTPTVTIDGNTATSGTDYTWSSGTLTIPANKINGNIVITLNSAAAAPSSVAITGNWLYFAGETIELTATPTGGNGPVTYQWYKAGKENGNAIEGATTATYTKATCAFEDAGSYYCKVTCGGSQSTWGQSGAAYNVKIPRLYVKTGRNDGVKSDFGNVDFTRATASTATASITLGSNWDYCFNIADGCGHYYGNAGTMQYNNYGPWTTNVNNQDCGLRTTNGATYVFTIDYSNWEQLKTTVTFPSSDQAADKIIYFDNQTVDWSTLHYRIGRADHTQATPMTKVPGTNNLYTVTTAAYNNAAGWHIANNAGWTGSNSIYRTYTNDDEYSITYATAHEGGAVTDAAVTVTPTTSRGTGADAGINDNCTFYNYEITTGMKTQNVAISDYSNGTITVNYVNTSNEAATLTSGDADLAHSVILTSITAVPNTGYDASAITINGGAYSANYVVTSATTIAASFTPHVYTITYKDQGDVAFSGTHADGYPTTHTYASATTLKTATKTGYTFDGWYTSTDCSTGLVTTLGATAFSADITLYAKWTVNNYDLTWNLGGGTTTSAGTGIGNGVSSNTTTSQAFGTALTAPTVTKTGYNFSAWSPTVAGTMPAANTTYTATWTVKTITITWDAEGGTVSPTTSSYTYDGSTVSLPIPTRDGYTFEGWWTGDDGTGTQITEIGTTNKPSADITYHAKWTVDDGCRAWAGTPSAWTDSKVTVGTLQLYGSSPTDKTKINEGAKVWGNSHTETVIAISAKNNYIEGHFTDGSEIATVTISAANNKGTASTDKEYVVLFCANSSFSSGVTYQTHSAPSYMDDKNDAKLVHEFTAPTGTTYFRIYIQIDSEVGGINNVGDGNTTRYYRIEACPKVCSTPAAPTAFSAGSITSTGATFSITDAADAASYDIYYSESSTAPTAGTAATTTSTSKTKAVTGLTASTTYYAWVRSVCDASHKSAWVAGSSFTTSAAATLYTVTFNSNGGSAVSPIEQASEGASITMPTPTKSGYTFQGWVIGGTTKAAGAEYTPTANVTAYATWKENCTGGGGGGTTLFSATHTSSSTMSASTGSVTLSSTSSEQVNNGIKFSGDGGYIEATGTSSFATGDVITVRVYNASGSTADRGFKLHNTSGTAHTASIGATSTADIEYTLAAADIESNGKLRILRFNSNVRIQSVTVVRPAGTCFYVTYNGNGAEAGSISDATAYAASDEVTVSSNTGASAFTKSGYHVGSWNTAANGSGTTYALGATFNISADVTLYAQWVADACSAPSAPTISGTSVRTAGQTIELTAFCESGKDASTTYTWYKGETFAGAVPVQAPLTIEEGGRIFNKASCASGDAGTYWCEASNGDGCAAHNATGFTVTVNSAVATHIYYYKDADHYDSETDTYYNPEGNTATLKDNQNLSSPWTICNACMTGVDSVVAHGATYDGKGNWVNAYIKIPKEGTATTNNIKFALSAGYTGTLTIKIGKYKDDSTVPTASLKLNGEGDAITPTSGSVGGVATTENNLSTVEWPLNTAGGTYILTVASSNAYISQIDMTTTPTAASFSVTYNGNGNTGGSVPTTTNHEASTTVTAAANSGSLVKTNYTGAGWNTANNGTGTNYVPGSGTFTITANMTLYAHWTQLITLAPGTQGTGTNNAAVSWNGSVLRGFAAHTASGYALQGYYTEPSGGTKVLNADGSFAATNIDGFVTSGKWSNTGAAPTLYAQWEASSLLKWNLKVNVSESPITTLSKESAAPTVISVANMSNLDSTGVTIEASKRSALTSKISTPAEYDADQYVSVQFEVASGYKLIPSDIKVKVQPVSSAKYAKLVLSDESSHEISYTTASKISGGSTQTVTMTNDEEVEFTGTVTLKIYCYGAADKYRLGTPIEINGSVEEACTPPTFSGISYNATEYTVGASASAISVTGAANVDSYQWKYNTVNDRTSGTNCGTGVSVTPSTESTGTLYYWCEMTNGCTTVKTAAVGIMVRTATTDPTVTWSNVKLGATDNVTPNYGGGNYVLRATVDQSAWTGTLDASMITAPAGITIHHVTTGTDASSKKYIEFKFDVTTAFDRASNATIDFNIALPEVGSYSELNDVKNVDYTACTEGTGAAGMVYIPLTATQQTSKSGMQNYWETAEAGRVASNYGSTMSATYNSTGYLTADHTFNYYAASTNDKWMFQTYVGGVNKVRVAFYAQGALSSSNLTIKKFLYDTEYFSSQGDRDVSIGEVNASQASFAAGENGYIEFTVPEMAANSYAYFQTGSSNMKIYGLVLYTENAGTGGSVATNPIWSDSKEDEFTVTKAQSDANFTYTISTTTNTLGAISYSSSNPSVAAVDPVTGEVTITATGTETKTAVITATLARSGCYQGATRTYTVQVTGLSCSDVAGTITTEDLGCGGIKMTLSGYTEGATIQWYKDGATIDDDGGEPNVYTTTAAGRYYAVTQKDCNRTSNTVEVAGSSVSATREVSKWYIKNGRPTPDIKLWTLGKGTHLESVEWSPDNDDTGLTGAEDIYERDGAVWLTGREPNTNSGEDVSYTLTLTVNNGCSATTAMSDASQQITIVHQKNTDKHVLAFVVNGTAKGGFTEGITAAQTTNVDLYNAIAAQFDVQATNIYSTDDEQKLREYYSQYDILCITDYPNTQTKGANSKSYVDAIGALIDIRPILTMEAFVSSLSNWKLKGVSGNPKSPTTRQYTMDLQCKDHEIFHGVTTTKIGEGDEAMYRVTVVDKSQEEYKTLDANYGDGEHKANEGYQYGKKPALQGFTYTEEMSDNDMLPLGLIDDGAGNKLQVGIERQKEMSARMMVLGINSYAMERLDGDGETIVINALKYLMKKNAEDISDCSVYFDGSDETDPTNWDNELNWGPSYASLPLPHQEVRILKECVVKDGVVARASGIKIIPRGRINHDTDDASGSLTIEPGGALIVDGKVRAAVAPNYFNATPTTPSNLVLQSNSSAQAALILDNSEGETQATVTVRSKANKDEGTRNWQYLTSPLQETPVTEFFYGVGTYTYKHSEADGGWVRYGLGTTFQAFDAIGLTQNAAKDFVFYGPLAPTGEWELNLTKVRSGNNLFGNSWTAPIDLKALVNNTDFDSNIDLDLAIYNTGADKKNGEGEFDQAANADNTPGTWHHVPLELATLEAAGWMGLKVIPAYQAFQLKVKDGASSATLTIDYDKCVRGSESKNYTEPLRSPGHRAAGKSNSDIEALRLAVSDAKGIAYIYLLEGEQFTEGYDNGWELEYKPNSKYGKLYAISPEQGDMMALARPSLEGTMVGFQPGESSEYTITFNETDGYYYLNDLKMEQSTLIQAGESYTFSVEEGESANRFLISSVPFDKPGIVTGVTNPNAEAPKAQKVIYNDKLYIIRGGKVFSADGQLVK